MASPRAGRWHPEQRIEFGVTGLDERMWSGQIDRLSSKNPNCVCVFGRQCIVRQMLVKIEGRHVREPTMPVEIAHGCQRCNLVSSRENRGAKSKAIFHRHAEALH